MLDIVDNIIIDAQQIKAFTERLAGEIANGYADTSQVLVLYVLKGAHVFTQGLRQTEILDENRFRFHAIRAGSYYHQTSSSGQVKLDLQGVEPLLPGADILLVDDIYDTGNTLHAILDTLQQHKPNSVRVCVMLQRDCEHEKNVQIDFLGTHLPGDRFVIGYGLDYKDQYRDLPYVATVKPEYQVSETES